MNGCSFNNIEKSVKNISTSQCHHRQDLSISYRVAKKTRPERPEPYVAYFFLSGVIKNRSQKLNNGTVQNDAY